MWSLVSVVTRRGPATAARRTVPPACRAQGHLRVPGLEAASSAEIRRFGHALSFPVVHVESGEHRPGVPVIDETRFIAVRRRIRSTRTADEVLTRLARAMGKLEGLRIEDLAVGAHDAEQFRAAVTARVGPSGFILFETIDHGAWLAHFGIQRKVVRLILGNPLIAITMMRHDPTAGLFAPVEILVLAEDGGGCSVVWLLPSSVIAPDGTGELASAAQALDGKLEALVSDCAD
jgi:uncharacterized protein (DUF302 family)